MDMIDPTTLQTLWFVLIVVIAVFIVADRFTVAGLGLVVKPNRM